MKMQTRMWTKVLAVIAAMMLGVAGVRAEDVVTLNNGTVYRGAIEREVDGWLWIRVKIAGIETVQVVAPADVKSVERDAAKPVAGPEAVKPADPKPATRRPGVTRAAVITLGEGGDKDMVGMYMTAETLRRAIPVLERDQVDIVVFRINSGGGALLEIKRLSDIIHEEFKPRFRVVAWIEWAISAAAMTAHAIPEIYFTTKAAYGGCTGWSGPMTAMAGRGLEEVLYMMEQISARGGYDPKIMRSMQILEPLSATIDANGDVTWYQNEEGDHLVNPGDKILTFDSTQAAKFKFSKGTADTLQELEKLLKVGEIEWVGSPVPGIMWPVSQAEQMQMQFREKTYEDQIKLQEYWDTYATSIQVAQGIQDRRERAPFVGRARRAFDQIKAMCKNNPNHKLLTLGMLDSQFDEWVEQNEKLLRDLMR